MVANHVAVSDMRVIAMYMWLYYSNESNPICCKRLQIWSIHNMGENDLALNQVLYRLSMGYSPIHGMHMCSIPGPRKSPMVTMLAVDGPGYPSVA